MAHASAKKARPLSPHLQVYGWSWTMAMSVAHRVTGAALYVGSLLLAWYLVAAAVGGGYFEAISWLFGSFLGRLVMFGYTWALAHHALGGLRHFVWDFGHGYELKDRMLLAKATLFGSLALTVILWIISFI